MSDSDTRVTTSDETLIANARSGDQGAFAELWRRHYRSGARVARQFTSSIDADDLVSEAYTRIYQRVLAGGGPSGAFRPYLYTTIRNLASTWGAASRVVQVDDIQDFEDPSTVDDPAANALDRTLTARAFRTLPERWQSVLWYTEVEGLDPHEVAPLLGMSANGVAALGYRAREGLRKAWLQAHVSDAGVSESCKWTMSRLGDNARHSLTERETEKVKDHLKTCTKCSIISEEVDEVGSHLAMVLIPILLGGVAGGALLASLGHAGTAAAASALVPAVPASFAVLSGSTAVAPAVAAGLSMGAATGMSALVGSLAVAATIGGGIAFGLAPQPHDHNSDSKTVASAPLHPGRTVSAHGSTNNLVPTPVTTGLPSGPGGDTTGVDGVVGGVTSGVDGVGRTVDKVVTGVGNKVVDPVLAPVVGALTPGASPNGNTAPGGTAVTADIKLDLSGKGTPGATVTAHAGGVGYGSVKVKSNGTWSMLITALPAGTKTVQLKQHLVLLGIEVPINIPLTLSTGALGVVVQLLN
jgi:RNA polymerase sigma factor (sigma-70 family)